MTWILVLYLHQHGPSFACNIHSKGLEAPSELFLLSFIAVIGDQIVYDSGACMILCLVSLNDEQLVLKFLVLTLEGEETIMVGLE